MEEWLGVDSIGYLSAEGLVSSTIGLQPHEMRDSANNSGFCRACFTGDYPVPITSCLEKVHVSCCMRVRACVHACVYIEVGPARG
jgi:amidophosphoribosyltransferase